jgi:SOS-response transcriptional repressor LexA
MKRNADGLTDIQQKVLDFMHTFHAANDQLPTMRALSDHFDWKSGNAAVEHCHALEVHGKLEKNAVGKYRFVRPRVAATAFPAAQFRGQP